MVNTLDINKIKNNNSNISQVIYGTTLAEASSNTNIATRGTASASGQKGDYSPSKAIDGNTSNNNSRWVSREDWGGYKWLTVKLDKTYIINRIDLYMGYAGRDEIKGYFLQYKDNDDWVDILRVTDNNETYRKHEFEPIITDEIRIYIPAKEAGTSYQARLYEIEIYEGGTILTPNVIWEDSEW